MSFKDIFNIDAEVKESAHARVNLIGEHTDYTGGYVMPTLLSFKNTIEISQNNSNEFTVYSQHFKEKKTFNDFKKSINNEWVCLLYTSPSPRDIPLSRMPSSA